MFHVIMDHIKIKESAVAGSGWQWQLAAANGPGQYQKRHKPVAYFVVR